MFRNEYNQNNNNLNIENFSDQDDVLNNKIIQDTYKSDNAFTRMTILQKIQFCVLILIIFIVLLPIFFISNTTDLRLWYTSSNVEQSLGRINNGPLGKFIKHGWFVLILIYLLTDVSNLFLGNIDIIRRLIIAFNTFATFLTMVITIRSDYYDLSHSSMKLIIIALFVISIVMRYWKPVNTENFKCGIEHDEDKK